MWKTFLTSRTERNNSVRHFRHFKNNSTTAACSADLWLLVATYISPRFSATLHRNFMKYSEKKDKVLTLLNFWSMRLMSIMYKNVVPTLQNVHFIHITKDDILILFSENLSDILSEYHSYSESKGFEADT